MPRPKGKSRKEWNLQHSKCINKKIKKEIEKETDFAAVFMATKFLIQDVDDLRFAIRWICIMFIIMILIVWYLIYKIYPLM